MLLSFDQIDVECFIRYCTDETLTREQSDWISYDIVQIIKGKTFGGYFYFQVGGVNQRINAQNSMICLNEIVRQCATKIKDLCPGGATIVPVPNSDGTMEYTDFKTCQMARKIDAQLPDTFDAYPLLVWCEPQDQASKGLRRRDWREHLPKLCMNGDASRPIVLFDDVITTGSQMYACKRKLEDEGLTVAAMIAVASVLTKDGATHADAPGWMTVIRCF